MDSESVTRAIQDRQRIVSSWIGPGIAIPHARLAETWRLLFAHALSVADAVKASAVVLHGDAAGNTHDGAAAKYDMRRRQPRRQIFPAERWLR